MAECLTLAALAHLLLVLLLGSAPGGSAREGQGVWGAINVTLRGPNRGSGEEATVASDAYTGPSGTAEQRRWGGVVRSEQAPPVPDQAGAARQGQWQPKPSAGTADAPPSVAPAGAAPVQEPAAPLSPAEAVLAVPEPQSQTQMQTQTQRAVPSAMDLPPRISADVPMPVPVQAIPQQAPPLPMPAPPPAPMPAAVPAPSPARPLAPVVPPTPASPPPRSAVPPAPVPAPPAPVPAPPAPVPAPPAPVPAPPAPVPAPPAPVPAPPAPAPAPAPVPAPPAPVPAPPAPVPAPPAPVPARVAPAPVAAPQIGLDGLAAAPSRTGPKGASEAGTATRPAAGAPDAGAQVGHDVATPPSLPASAPKLNLELVRPRGGELSRLPAPGVLRVLPRPPDEPPKSKLAESMEKAQKPDCRTAYANMGVAAVAPLVRDAVTGEGCRW